MTGIYGAPISDDEKENEAYQLLKQKMEQFQVKVTPGASVAIIKAAVDGISGNHEVLSQSLLTKAEAREFLRLSVSILTDDQLDEILQSPDTQFEVMEMINLGTSGYFGRVRYEIEVLDHPDNKLAKEMVEKRDLLRCPRCGQTGYSGAYPFSTVPPNCDDCN